MTEPSEAYEEFLDLLHGATEGLPTREDWCIQDEGLADWACRKIGAAQTAMATRAAYVAGEIERLQAWQHAEDARDQRIIEFFTAHLQRYADQLVEAGVLTERRKSLKLPHGTIGYRSVPIMYERDDAKILAWLKADTGLAQTCIRTKEELAWHEFKALIEACANEAMSEVTAFGEVVPGLRVKTPAGQRFDVKPSLD